MGFRYYVTFLGALVSLVMLVYGLLFLPSPGLGESGRLFTSFWLALAFLVSGAFLRYYVYLEKERAKREGGKNEGSKQERKKHLPARKKRRLNG